MFRRERRTPQWTKLRDRALLQNGYCMVSGFRCGLAGRVLTRSLPPTSVSAVGIDVISLASNSLNAKRSTLNLSMKPHVFRSNRWIVKWRKLVH
jgi:hypothetical protein